MAFSPPPTQKYIRVPGHAYQKHSMYPNTTGGPFLQSGAEARSGFGRGKCECGLVSPKGYIAKAGRLKWHFEHRLLEAAKLQAEFEKEEGAAE